MKAKNVAEYMKVKREKEEREKMIRDAAPVLLAACEYLTAYAAQYTGNGCTKEEGKIVDRLNSANIQPAEIVNNARAAIKLARGEG